MLMFSVSQIEALEAHARSQFVQRVDAFMRSQMGKRWIERPLPTRRSQIEAGVQRGLALGIEEEVYVAQFALVHLLRGESFLREPASSRILDDPAMDWRQKLFQLIALAGIDLSDGAARGS